VLGVDAGERRIGLALSDPTGVLASPWRTLALDATGDPAALVLGVIRTLQDEDEGLGAVVIGLPRRLDGTPTHHTARAVALADTLRARAGVPVLMQDERLSSVEAESRLASRERDWRRRKARLDAASAAVILQDYLDQHAHGS
jgi:putative Holliday junction resolvase